MIYKKYVLITTFVVSLMASLPLALIMSESAAAACSPSANYGTVTEMLRVPSASTYRIWSRLKTATPASNSYLLEVDGYGLVSGHNVALLLTNWGK